MNITFEERQLMSLYNTGTRTGLIAALEEMRGYLAADETELRELTDSAIAPKGNALTPLLYAIHCERRKELFLEGDRWYELKRNGCPEFWVAYPACTKQTYLQSPT